MAIKITKQGLAMSEMILNGKCELCGAEVECEMKDAIKLDRWAQTQEEVEANCGEAKIVTWHISCPWCHAAHVKLSR